MFPQIVSKLRQNIKIFCINFNITFVLLPNTFILCQTNINNLSGPFGTREI